jgi:hypothetical protein
MMSMERPYVCPVAMRTDARCFGREMAGQPRRQISTSDTSQLRLWQADRRNGKRTKAKINAMKRPADLVAAQEKMRSKHEGRTTTAPQPFLLPTDSAVEQHFPRLKLLSSGALYRTVRRLFITHRAS